MTTIPPIIDEAEGLVRQLATELTRVREGECLCCYVARQLDEYPCDGTHRHAFRYRDAVAPRATALDERLSRLGACCCDCELFLNGYELHPRLGTPVREVDDDGIVTFIGTKPPEQLPPCAGVRRGSVRPCGNWVRLRRW
jgi:Protein of unknown function (DUF2695)